MHEQARRGMRRTRWLLLSVLVWTGVTWAAPAFTRGPFKAETRRYRVLTDIDQVCAVEVARHLESISRKYQQCFASFQVHVGDKYDVRVYADRKSYVKDVGEKYENTGGLHLSGEHAVVTFKGSQSWERVYLVMYHECCHQFFRAVIGQGPQWINEGLAVFFESAVWNGKSFDVGEVPVRSLQTLQSAFESGNYLHLRDLITMSHEQWLDNMGADRDDPARHEYSYAWSFVHFLAYGNRGRNKPYLDKYLRVLKQGMSREDAFSSVFGPEVDRIEAAWIDYVKKLEPTPHQVCPENLRMLAAAVTCSAPRFRRQRPKMQEFYKIVKEGLWPELKARRASGSGYTALDVDTMCGWFRCPAHKRKRKKVTYRFEWPRGRGALPDIVCKSHGRVTYRANVVEADGKVEYKVTRSVR